MAKIGEGILKDFIDGETLHDVDFDQLFETIRIALNDADDKASNSTAKVVEFEGRVSGLEFVGNNRDVRIREVFTATEGQTLFTLTKGTYKIGANLLDVAIENSATYNGDTIDQATIWSSVLYAGNGLTETSSSSFTLDTPLTDGTVVTATYYLAAPPLGLNHGATHKLGGADELNVTELAGYSTITDNIATAKSEAITAAAADASTKASTAETNAKNASIPTTQKAAANGVATLDANGKLVQIDTKTYGSTTPTVTLPMTTGAEPTLTVTFSTVSIPIGTTAKEVAVFINSVKYVVTKSFNYVEINHYDKSTINAANKGYGTTSVVASRNDPMFSAQPATLFGTSDVRMADALISGTNLVLKFYNAFENSTQTNVTQLIEYVIRS